MEFLLEQLKQDTVCHNQYQLCVCSLNCMTTDLIGTKAECLNRATILLQSGFEGALFLKKIEHKETLIRLRGKWEPTFK